MKFFTGFCIDVWGSNIDLAGQMWYSKIAEEV